MMTVSQDKVIPGRYWRDVPALLPALTLAAFIWSTPASSTQESDQPEKSTEKSAEKPVPAPQIKKTGARRTTYHVGGKPSLAGRSMPELAAPGRIIPQPFMPKGSIQPPPINTDSAQETSEAEPLTDPLKMQTGDAIFSESLMRPDPGTPGLPGGGEPLWQGYSRPDVIRHLALLGAPSRSPTLQHMTRQLLLSPFALPANQSDEDINSLLAARLDGLQRIAHRNGFAALVSSLPGDRDFTPLARKRAVGALLTSAYDSACALTEKGRTLTTEDAFWLRLGTLCSALKGDTSNSDFQIGLLEEVGAADPAFIQLVDHILRAARSDKPVQVLTLKDPLTPDLLSAVAAYLSGARITTVSDQGIEPFGLALLLDYSELSQGARLKLLDIAAQKGRVEPKQILRFASLGLPEANAATPSGTSDSDERSDAPVSGWPETVSLLAAALAEKDSTARLDHYAAIWHQASVDGQLSVVAGAIDLMLDVGGMPASPMALAAIPARAALMSQNVPRAAMLIRDLRSLNTTADSPAGQALIGLWPLIQILENTAEKSVDADQYALWMERQMWHNDRLERAGLFLGLVEALGTRVPEAIWQSLETGVGALDANAASPVQWRALMRASAEGDKSRLLASSVALLSGTGLDNASPSAIIAVVSALHQNGEKELARQLAVEALILRGF